MTKDPAEYVLDDFQNLLNYSLLHKIPPILFELPNK